MEWFLSFTAATRAAESSLGAGEEPGVVVRENQAGDIYRGQSLHFRELSAAATALSEGRGAAPSPAPPSPKPTPTAARPHHSPAANHPWRQGWQNMKIPPSLTHGTRGHLYCEEDRDTSNVVCHAISWCIDSATQQVQIPDSPLE